MRSFWREIHSLEIVCAYDSIILAGDCVLGPIAVKSKANGVGGDGGYTARGSTVDRFPSRRQEVTPTPKSTCRALVEPQVFFSLLNLAQRASTALRANFRLFRRGSERAGDAVNRQCT